MSTPPPSTADWVRWMARPVGRAERERAAKQAAALAEEAATRADRARDQADERAHLQRAGERRLGRRLAVGGLSTAPQHRTARGQHDRREAEQERRGGQQAPETPTDERPDHPRGPER